MIVESLDRIKSPEVSVIVITFNQEKTIAQTIESILMQKGEFSMELVIGEDGGSDSTANICREYQKKFPDQIRLLLQDENQGIVKNFIDTLRMCRGKFIGICAGDDYWIDERKIAKQLDFFKTNPAYGVVSTGGYKLQVEKNKLLEGLPPLNPVTDGKVFDKTWPGGVYAMPLSLLIKVELLKLIDFNEFIKRNFSVEDVPIQAILSKHTLFGHIPDLCVVYRVYNTSQTFINFNHPRYLYYHQGLVEIRRYLDELFPEEVEFSEQWAHDYMAYRRFLVAVYNFNYLAARNELMKLQQMGSKERRAFLRTKSKLGFYIFAIVKRIILLKSRLV